MKLTGKPSIVNRISSMLDKEAAFLIAGDLHLMGSLMDERKNLFLDIQKYDLRNNSIKLSTIHQKAVRNDHLYNAALRGLKLATKRVIDIRSTISDLHVYEVGGKRSNKSISKISFSRKL